MEKGARRDATDYLGRNAGHLALREAFAHPQFAQNALPALWTVLAPLSLDLRIGDRLVRLERHQAEYFLVQSIWALIPITPVEDLLMLGFNREVIEHAWEFLPEAVLPTFRKKRNYISAILARNEVQRDYAYNRHLFLRVASGVYLLQPDLFLRDPEQDGQWQHWTHAHNLPFLEQHFPIGKAVLNRVLTIAQAPLDDSPASMRPIKNRKPTRTSRANPGGAPQKTIPETRGRNMTKTSEEKVMQRLIKMVNQVQDDAHPQKTSSNTQHAGTQAKRKTKKPA